jgi:hypothetical protein
VRQFQTVCSLPRRFKSISESDALCGYGLLESDDQLYRSERELVGPRVVSEADVLYLEQCLRCVDCDAAAVYHAV